MSNSKVCVKSYKVHASNQVQIVKAATFIAAAQKAFEINPNTKFGDQFVTVERSGKVKFFKKNVLGQVFYTGHN